MWAMIILKPAITISASKKSLKIVFYIYTQIQTAYTLTRMTGAHTLTTHSTASRK